MSSVHREWTLDAVEKTTPYLIADLEDVTLQFHNMGASDSVDVQVSNSDGFDSALTDLDFDNVGSAVTADGVQKLDPGGRWLRLEKTAHTNSVTVSLHGKTSY